MAYAWIEVSPGRSIFRKITDHPAPQRSHLAAPRVLRDTFDKPVQSMANGEWYTSKRGLAASHRASGNPHGQDFIELGNEHMPFVEHKTSETELRDDIRSAMADVKAGNLPPILALDD
jgi:hypothetical protein